MADTPAKKRLRKRSATRKPAAAPARAPSPLLCDAELGRLDALGAEERCVFSALMDHIPDAIYFKDEQSRFTLINRALATRFGLAEPAQAVGKTDFDFFDEDHAGKAFADEQQVMRTGKSIVAKEERETWPDGSRAWASTTKLPLANRDGKIIGTFGISRDITPRKLVEAKLEESEARFRALIQMAPDIIYRVDTAGKLQFISQAVSFLGYTPDDLLGEALQDLVHPADVDKMKWALRERRIGARATRDLEVRLRRKLVGPDDGIDSFVSVAITARGIWDVPDDRIHEPGKTFLGTEGVIRDITRRKRAEEELARHRGHLEELVAERTAELRESNQQLEKEIADRLRAEQALRAERDRAQNYLDIAATLFVVLDSQGRVSMINRKGCEILGYEEKDLVGRDWFATCIPPSEARSVREAFGLLMQGQAVQVQNFENRVLTRTGDMRIIAWHNTVLSDEAGRITGTLSSGEDITQRKRAEEALLQTERFEAIGTLAQGVAYNFNNVISLISGCASSISSNSIPGTSAHEEALRILGATRHASDLTKRLMSVARASSAADTTNLQLIPLSKVVRDAAELVKDGFAEKGVQIQIKDPETMPYVKADANQLFDAFMVFLLNAQQAMPNGGSITVDVVAKRIARPPLGVNAKAEGGVFAVLRIRDTGIGIQKETVARIFEPFFTTKHFEFTLGLGLTFARSIAQALGGWISVRSREGRGTSFRVFLPRATPPAPVAEPVPEEITPDGETILVVDDGTATVKLSVNALKAAGFRVLAAGSAAEAMALYRDHSSDITLAVVDAIMPDGKGPAVVQEIVKRDPRAAIVVTSGFSREFVRSLVPLGVWTFLQKPFDGVQLLEKVKDGLRRQRA
jgi:PAS domain S-box-containing protein